MVLGDISAEELFNMFFGAGFQTGTYCIVSSMLTFANCIFFRIKLSLQILLNRLHYVDQFFPLSEATKRFPLSFAGNYV